MSQAYETAKVRWTFEQIGKGLPDVFLQRRDNETEIWIEECQIRTASDLWDAMAVVDAKAGDLAHERRITTIIQYQPWIVYWNEDRVITVRVQPWRTTESRLGTIDSALEELNRMRRQVVDEHEQAYYTVEVNAALVFTERDEAIQYAYSLNASMTEQYDTVDKQAFGGSEPPNIQVYRQSAVGIDEVNFVQEYDGVE